MPSSRTVVRRALAALAVVASPLVAERAGPVGADTGPLRPICFPVIDPVTFTDTFGDPRDDGRTHEGIDLMGEKMDRLVATADGEVVDVRGPGSGDDTYSVRLVDDDGWYHVYLHLNDDTPGTDDGLATDDDVMGPGIAVGERVVAGQLVGYMGDSGNAEGSGAHLHYELREPAPVVWDSVAVNPYASLVAAQAAGGCSAITAPEPGSSPEAPDPSVTRLAGDERVATAAAISRSSYPGSGSADAVVLAAADRFPDALAATPLAAASDGPLLLTQGDTLSDAARTETLRVLADGGQVILVGGELALGAAVSDELVRLGFDVTRYAGRDRYETAVAIAHDALGIPDRVLVATGLDFPDSLGAGAAAAAIGAAVVLTEGDELPPSTAAFLAEHPDSVPVAIGGPATGAVPGVDAVAGGNRYETSVLLAERYFPTAEVVGLASGREFPDGLAGGAHIGAAGGPMLVVEPDQLPGEVDDYLLAHAGTLATAFVYGGDDAVVPAVFDAVLAALT